jgi:hypothetical protein
LCNVGMPIDYQRRSSHEMQTIDNCPIAELATKPVTTLGSIVGL